MKVILISGDGNGAGKTTFAKTFGTCVLSLADAVRRELDAKYPDYNWFSRDSKYKNIVHISELNMTMRQALVEHGQGRCLTDPNYWVDRLVTRMKLCDTLITGPVIVDDLRKWPEYVKLRRTFPDALHFHMESPQANAEPQYDNDTLKSVANYIVRWDNDVNTKPFPGHTEAPTNGSST